MAIELSAQAKVIYDYQFLQILRIRSGSGTHWVVRRLQFEEPEQIESDQSFDSLSEALNQVREEVEVEEQYATPIDIPDLSEATRARLDGELPRLFCIDPSKLITD
jgi:hypothetical protein